MRGVRFVELDASRRVTRHAVDQVNPSTKVVHDLDGEPWLVVATPEGYEAWRVQIAERHLFDRSWQAVRFASEHGESGPGAGPKHDIGDLIHIGLTPVEWSLLVTGAERGPIAAAHEVAARVAAEVKQVQHLRIQADIADATYNYSPCEWQDGA